MIKKNSEMAEFRQEKLFGGKGGAWCQLAVNPQNPVPGLPLKMIGRTWLDPGADVAEHFHVDDDEIYLIVSGSGIYYEKGEPFEVGEGDVLILQRGGSHGLHNTGSEPLVFFAIKTL